MSSTEALASVVISFHADESVVSAFTERREDQSLQYDVERVLGVMPSDALARLASAAGSGSITLKRESRPDDAPDAASRVMDVLLSFAAATVDPTVTVRNDGGISVRLTSTVNPRDPRLMGAERTGDRHGRGRNDAGFQSLVDGLLPAARRETAALRPALRDEQLAQWATELRRTADALGQDLASANLPRLPTGAPAPDVKAPPDDLLPLSKAAQKLRVDLRTIRQFVAAGKLATYELVTPAVSLAECREFWPAHEAHVKLGRPRKEGQPPASGLLAQTTVEPIQMLRALSGRVFGGEIDRVQGVKELGAALLQVKGIRLRSTEEQQEFKDHLNHLLDFLNVRLKGPDGELARLKVERRSSGIGVFRYQLPTPGNVRGSSTAIPELTLKSSG